MNVTIKYFGLIAEAIEKKEEVLRVDDGILVNELEDQLKAKYPELSSKVFRIAVNQDLAEGNASIPDNSEIALLPAYAGG